MSSSFLGGARGEREPSFVRISTGWSRSSVEIVTVDCCDRSDQHSVPIFEKKIQNFTDSRFFTEDCIGEVLDLMVRPLQWACFDKNVWAVF